MKIKTLTLTTLMLMANTTLAVEDSAPVQEDLHWETNGATGFSSTAWGSQNKATEYGATAWGSRNKASGIQSTAWGNNNAASGLFSSTWGQINTTSGDYSTSWGTRNTASGYNSTAWGMNTIASGTSSTAFGDGIIVSGNYSVGIGLYDYTMNTDPSWFTEVADERTFAIMGGKVQICDENGACINNLQREIHKLKSVNIQLLARLEALENRLNKKKK